MSSSLSSFKFGSSSSPSGSSKGKEDENIVSFGSPFPEAIKKTPYKYVLNQCGEYIIYLDSSGYHWYMMVHYNMEGGNFPKISFEITCDKLVKGDLIPTMRVLEENESDTEIFAYGHAIKAALDNVSGGVSAVGAGAMIGGVAGPAGMVLGGILGYIVGAAGGVVAAGVAGGGGVRGTMLSMSGTKLRKVGTLTTTIMKLCETAKAVQVGMGKYNLITNNCQHFCNNVLQKLGLPTTRTTVGPTTTEVKGNFDEIDQIFTIAPDKKDNECDGDTKG